MRIKEEYKPLLSMGHYVTIWIFIAGVLIAGLSRGVELEKAQAVTESRQRDLLERQDEIRQDVKDGLKEQRVILDTLIEIKTKMENQENE